MLKIFGDNHALWQWDTGQKLIVEDNGICREVHFCNNYSDKALVLPIMEQDGIRVVDVPNILLQEASMLTAYLFSYDANGSETKFAYRFSVRPRPKPDSYIYTETEVLNYASIDKRLNYLEQNQLLVGGFIASDVAPEDTSVLWIDTDEDEVDNVQNIIDEALAQAKISGEFDGKDGKDGYTPVKGVDYFDGKDGKNGSDYVLTESDKQEIAEQATQLIDIPESGSTESVQYTEQTLSEEQQMQARKNLGLYGITYEYDLLRQAGPNYAGCVWTLDPIPETINGNYRVEIWDESPSQLRFSANLQRGGRYSTSPTGGVDIRYFWGNPSLIKNDSEAAEIFSKYTDSVNDCPIVLYTASHDDYGYNFTRLYISPDLQPSYFLGFNVKIMSTVPHEVVNQIPEEYLPSSIAVQCVEQSLTEEQQMQARKNLGLHCKTTTNPIVVKLQGYMDTWDIEPYSTFSTEDYVDRYNVKTPVGDYLCTAYTNSSYHSGTDVTTTWSIIGNPELSDIGDHFYYDGSMYPFAIWNITDDEGDGNERWYYAFDGIQGGSVIVEDTRQLIDEIITIPEEYLPDSISNTINNEVVKHTEQSLTEEQQMQARKNLGLYGFRNEFVTLGQIKTVFGGETVDLAGYVIHAGLVLDTTKPLVMELFDPHTNITVHSATYYPQGTYYFDRNQYTDRDYWYWGNHSLLQSDATAWQYLSYYQDKNGYDDAPFVICSLFDEYMGWHRKLILSPDLEYPGGGGYAVILRSTEKETVYDKIPEEYLPDSFNEPGADGGYYTPSIEQTDANTMKVSYTASKGDMPSVADQSIMLPAGPKGDKYELTEADKQEIAKLTAPLVDVPEGGGSAEWRKVAEIKTTEDLTYISVTEDMDGNPLSFDEAILVFASASASDATTNGSVVVSAYPQWVSSFNKYGIHSIPLNADVYALSAHIKKHGELVEIEIDNRSRITGNLQGLTVWGSEAYGFTVGQLFTNYATRSLRYHRDTNVQNGIYQPSTKTLFDDSGKLMGVTIGTDLATSIKIGAGSTLEVWVR